MTAIPPPAARSRNAVAFTNDENLVIVDAPASGTQKELFERLPRRLVQSSLLVRHRFPRGRTAGALCQRRSVPVELPLVPAHGIGAEGQLLQLARQRCGFDGADPPELE